MRHAIDESVKAKCPVCVSGTSVFHERIDGYDYFHCEDCGSLHIDPATLAAIDAGESTRVYDESYWEEELKAARERASGESLVRAGEAILYARRPVGRFLDVGTGPGYLLDELARQFPTHRDIFHGVELFPPEVHSVHVNYLVGDVGDLHGAFDAGVCIEVIEHLTPKMLERLVDGLRRISKPDSLWLFNTSLAERTLAEDPGYLDPLRRGHIVSYSVQGLRRIFEERGFTLQSIPGKNYAFLAEFRPSHTLDDFEVRFRQPVSENRALLGESGLLYQAAFESACASFYYAQMLARSQWALDTNKELEAARQLYTNLRQEQEQVTSWAQSLDGELHELRESHTALQREHFRVLHSKSWKLTRPLRAVVAWGRGKPQHTDRSTAQTVHQHEAGGHAKDSD